MIYFLIYLLFFSLKVQEDRAAEYLEKYSKCNFERQQFRDKNESLELQISNAIEARYAPYILFYITLFCCGCRCVFS